MSLLLSQIQLHQSKPRKHCMGACLGKTQLMLCTTVSNSWRSKCTASPPSLIQSKSTFARVTHYYFVCWLSKQCCRTTLAYIRQQLCLGTCAFANAFLCKVGCTCSSCKIAGHVAATHSIHSAAELYSERLNDVGRDTIRQQITIQLH